MSKQRGSLLLLTMCAVLAVGGAYASPIGDPAIRHASALYGGAALQMPLTFDYWLGGSGNWTDNNWSAGPPGADSDVVIDPGDVFLDTNASIASLTLGGMGAGSLTDYGATLTIAGALTLNHGSLYLNYGSKVSAGSITFNGGNIQIISSSLTANAGFDNRGTVYLTGLGGGGSLEVLGDASNSGALILGTSGWLGNGNATIHGNFANEYGGLVHLDSRSQLEVKGTLTNEGSVELDDSYLTVSDVTNFGSIYTSDYFGGSEVTITGGLTNSGSFLLNGGGLKGDTTTVGSLINYGTIDLENASTLDIKGDVRNDFGATLSTSADASGGNVITIGGNLTNYGSFLLNGGPGKGDSATIGGVSIIVAVKQRRTSIWRTVLR